MWCDVMSSVGPSASVSWCKFECVIASPDNVKVMTEQAPTPPLVGGGGAGGETCLVHLTCVYCCYCLRQVVVSISSKTLINPKTSTNEVSD